jgi:hypothetical protein
MQANWRSTGVEQRRLAKKNEWSVGGETPFRFYNLIKSAPNVNGCGPRTFRSSPRNGRIQGIVNLEGSGAVTKTVESPAVLRWQLGACDTKKLARGDVGKNKISFRKLSNFVVRLNAAAKI